jgi:acetylornithine deacetylase/succinyl-diaminopimelate desuccinylase-like protein
MDINQEISRLCYATEFKKRIVQFLHEICSIDTSPTSDVAGLGAREKQVFDLIEQELNDFSFTHARMNRKLISPDIEKHPAYSNPYYALPDKPTYKLSAQDVYRDRCNLIYMVDHLRSESGKNVALNAHVDVVKPFFSPQLRGEYLQGRGSIDDKGNVAVIVGALAVLDALGRTDTVVLKNNITAMFVIDEETGGNGSLDLALDKDLKSRYDSILILECAGNNIYPANRGAVYFKCEAGFAKNAAGPSGRRYSLAEAFVYAILEMEKEGEAILEESDHPLFPQRPVQTCNGIIGPYGTHPSTTCDEVKFVLMNCDPQKGLAKIFEKGLADYIKKYGDKTTIIDQTTGATRLEKHFDCCYLGKDEIEITVYGIAGHSGALRQNDAAITKWAYMMKALLDQKHKGKLDFLAELVEPSDPQSLVLEGSQGFLPTHSIKEVKRRMATAFDRGIRRYIAYADLSLNKIISEVTFDKLHNNAFACDPDSASMRSALKAGLQSGIIRKETPVVGWDVSCDARLFAKEYPDMPVITAGVGDLIDAHGDDEKIHLPELFDCIYFTSLFLLMETGSLS